MWFPEPYAQILPSSDSREPYSSNSVAPIRDQAPPVGDTTPQTMVHGKGHLGRCEHTLGMSTSDAVGQ